VTVLFQLKQWMKRKPEIKRLALCGARVTRPLIDFARLSSFPRYARFVREWGRFRQAGGEASLLDLYPCLDDRTAGTGIDTHYFYQAIWAFRSIAERDIQFHIDVGSQVNLVGILTTVIPVVFLDIRPFSAQLSNYSGVAASFLALPFRDETVPSISSLHVIEHIGLGRYGDPIDPLGSIKAAKELVRVLAPGGLAYISVPIGRPRVQFNGQRIFAVTDVLKLFGGLKLVQMAMVDASGKYYGEVKSESADINELGQGSDFGLGLFCFQKSG
jgi:SAM-dependent methyltransferase